MADKNAFSEREMQIMAMAWQCFSEQPKVDYDKLSKLCGFTNVKSASNAWSAIKKKLAAQVADGDENGATTPKAAKTTPKKRTKKAVDEDDEEETPAKKTKGRKGKATPKTKAESGDDTGDDADADAVVKPEDGSDDNGLLN